MKQEFATHEPVRREGHTSVDMLLLLRARFPDVLTNEWMNWEPGGQYRAAHALGMMIGLNTDKKGTIDDYWSWERWGWPDYPDVRCWDGSYRQPGYHWTGLVEISGQKGENFKLVSYINSSGYLGYEYFVSTRDLEVLHTFITAVIEATTEKEEGILVQVWGDDDFYLPTVTNEHLLLPEGMKVDIETQVDAFFGQKELYKKLNIRYRRGFLLVGSPGNGKTMMIRHLIRKCSLAYGADAHILNVNRRVSEVDITGIIREASENPDAPGLVILEDMDSLTRESQLTRAGLLGVMDGVEPREGILIIGTTNNPEDIDPALVHRPSRFDRVWHFKLPELEMRRSYIDWAMPHIKESTRTKVAKKTKDWSFAYLNELRTTAFILAIHDHREEPTEQDVIDALKLLESQFKTAETGAVEEKERGKVGFESDNEEPSDEYPPIAQPRSRNKKAGFGARGPRR